MSTVVLIFLLISTLKLAQIEASGNKGFNTKSFPDSNRKYDRRCDDPYVKEIHRFLDEFEEEVADLKEDVAYNPKIPLKEKRGNKKTLLAADLTTIPNPVFEHEDETLIKSNTYVAPTDAVTADSVAVDSQW